MDITSCSPDIWLQAESEWLQLLENQAEWEKVPLYNATELHTMENSSLVRFRGMVQDMHTPEYYVEKLEVIKEGTNEKVEICGKYRDVLTYKENQSIDLDEAIPRLTSERQTLVVITDPAVNDWVKNVEKDASGSHMDTTAAKSANKEKKRSLDNDDENMEVDQCSSQATPCVNDKKSVQKKQRVSGESSQSCADTAKSNTILSKEYLLNFPLCDRLGKACHVKIYKNTDSVKVNDLCEFIGFLSMDPDLAVMPNEDRENQMEVQTHHPPPSLIPRLHCVSFKKLEHYNPLISTKDTSVKMEFLRKELLILLTQLLLGDELAAEYLICNLISEVYMREDLLSLGNFAINISNVPIFEDIDYVKEVYKFIEIMVTKSHYFPMTLENMNDLTFTPKKDYECNRLTSGMLQLSTNTHLILDETKLQAGKLEVTGVNNVKVLANVIKHQKLAYDFGYYPLEFNCDIPVLTFSEGKSMLPADCHVILHPDKVCLDTFSEILAAARHFLKPELLDQIRKYLTLCRMVKYDISDNIQQLVQNEFVSMRKKENVTAEDLHKLLVLSRLICISEGKSTLDEICWKRACQLEENRKKRISFR